MHVIAVVLLCLPVFVTYRSVMYSIDGPREDEIQVQRRLMTGFSLKPSCLAVLLSWWLGAKTIVRVVGDGHISYEI